MRPCSIPARPSAVLPQDHGPNCPLKIDPEAGANTATSVGGAFRGIASTILALCRNLHGLERTLIHLKDIVESDLVLVGAKLFGAQTAP